MSLGEVQVVVRSRTVRESFDLAFPFLWRIGGRRYVRFVVGVVGVCVGVTLLVCWGLQLSWAQSWLVGVPLGVVSQGLYTLGAGTLMFEQEFRARSVLRSFRQNFGRYCWAMLRTRLTLAIVGSLLFTLPFIWGACLFVPEAVLLERLQVGDAVARASRLGQSLGQGRRELLFWIAFTLLAGIAGCDAMGDALLEYTLQLDVPHGDLWNDGGSAFALVGWFAAVALTATARFLEYVDTRTRDDGWDVQVRFQRIAKEHGGAQ